MAGQSGKKFSLPSYRNSSSPAETVQSTPKPVQTQIANNPSATMSAVKSATGTIPKPSQVSSPSASAYMASLQQAPQQPRSTLTQAATETPPAGITIGSKGEWKGTPTDPYSKGNDARSAYLSNYSKSMEAENNARLEKARIENEQTRNSVQGKEYVNQLLDRSGGTTAGARDDAELATRRLGMKDSEYQLQKLANATLLSALSQNREASKPIEIGNSTVDPLTGQTIYTKPDEGFSLGQGQRRYDSSGKVIATGPQESQAFSLSSGQERYELDPKTGQYRKVAGATAKEEGSELLSPTEATSLGVPYGTTREQAFGTSPAKPFSGEASKLLSITETIQPEIQLLKKAFTDNYKGSLVGITTGTNRELVKLVDQVADKVGRLRSGGAINIDEANRFKSQIASIMDIPFGNSIQAINALDGILAEAQSVSTSIRGGNNQSYGTPSGTIVQTKAGPINTSWD